MLNVRDWLKSRCDFFSHLSSQTLPKGLWSPRSPYSDPTHILKPSSNMLSQSPPWSQPVIINLRPLSTHDTILFFSQDLYIFSSPMLSAICKYSSPSKIPDLWSVFTLRRPWLDRNVSLMWVAITYLYFPNCRLQHKVQHFWECSSFQFSVLYCASSAAWADKSLLQKAGSNPICSPCSVAIYMTSALSLGKYPDILAQLFWQQQLLPYGLHMSPEKISFLGFLLVVGT